MEKEVRSLKIPLKVEKRGAIVGTPIVYGRDSEDMGFIEQVAPGAAKNALKRSDIRALKNHDPSLIFGRQGVNLKFREDKNGLHYEATPIDTRNFNDISDEIKAGLLTGQSFGFTVLADEWKDIDTDHPRRTITEIGEIFDVGPVTYPAYGDTSVALRSLDKAKEEIPTDDEAEPEISIIFKGEQHNFTGDDAIERAAEKIDSIRSDLNPTIPGSDNATAVPTNATPDADSDLLETINQKLTRYKV